MRCKRWRRVRGLFNVTMPQDERLLGFGECLQLTFTLEDALVRRGYAGIQFPQEVGLAHGAAAPFPVISPCCSDRARVGSPSRSSMR